MPKLFGICECLEGTGPVAGGEELGAVDGGPGVQVLDALAASRAKEAATSGPATVAAPLVGAGGNASSES